MVRADVNVPEREDATDGTVEVRNASIARGLKRK